MQGKETTGDQNQTQTPDIPRVYLAGMLGALVLLILTVTITYAVRQRSPDGNTGAVAQEQHTPVASPTPSTPTPMPTELPPANAVALAQSTEDVALPQPTPTGPADGRPLPTPTPTPELPPAPPREVTFSGETTMRLALSGEGFDTTGRPLSFQIEPRTATVGGDVETITDTWCVQLGLVNELFDLSAQLDRASEELVVGGTVSLRGGFCEQPGDILDEVDVELSVPTGASAQISYNLRGRGSLLGLQGLLDSDTGTIVELRVVNAQPE